MIYLYADESGKAHQPNVEHVAFCGYVGHQTEWFRFQREWQNALIRWDVPSIHVSQIMSPTPKKEWEVIRAHWGSLWETKREEMLDEFAGIVRRASLAATGCLVDCVHFRNLPESEFKTAAKDPHYLAFQYVALEAIRITERVDDCSPIGIVVDGDNETSAECFARLIALKDQSPKAKKRIHMLGFANDSSFPGIQAADMLAYESRRLMAERSINKYAIPSKRLILLTLDFVHQPHLMTAQKLDELSAIANGLLQEHLNET